MSFATVRPWKLRLAGMWIARGLNLVARSGVILGLALPLLLLGACNRSPGVPDSSSDTSQKLPFDREPSSSGTSPSQSLVPPNRIPEGTSLTVSLSKTISSGSARAGDSFDGVLDDPIVVDEQTLLPRGSQVKGRVLEAKPSSGANDPGYVRIVLVSVDVRGNNVLIDGSSIFAKAPVHPDSSSPAAAASTPNDVMITTDRRLTFRLARHLDLQ